MKTITLQNSEYDAIRVGDGEETIEDGEVTIELSDDSAAYLREHGFGSETTEMDDGD